MNKTKGLPPDQGELMTSRHLIQSFRYKADQKRTVSEKFADAMTTSLGSMKFLVVNVLWFAIWIIVNTGILPGVAPFDPFPFGLLTMVVSLEAIVLSIIVLISQNRTEKIDELRQEVDLQVDMICEEEITKLLKLVTLLLEKQGIDLSEDGELQEMLTPTNVEKLESILEQQIIHQPAKASGFL
jgi:uncharacterized membrane protein